MFEESKRKVYLIGKETFRIIDANNDNFSHGKEMTEFRKLSESRNLLIETMRSSDIERIEVIY